MLYDHLIPRLSSAVVALALAGGAAPAEVPVVAADIAPVHSLAALVMDGVGAPLLVIPPGASPHGHALRPSEAAALQEADLVVWVGSDLTPWLGGAIPTLAPNARILGLLNASGTTTLGLRADATFEGYPPAGDGHDHGGRDPHAWLDPANGAAWLDAIAAALSDIDPVNAAAYRANAAAGRAEIETAAAEVGRTLAPVRGHAFVVFHDAFRYFEDAFAIPAAGAISLSDAARPGPARVAAIRDRIARQDVTCVLAEPQFNPDLVAAVVDGTAARPGVADPLGAGLAPGPTLYPTLLRDLGRALANCL